MRLYKISKNRMMNTYKINRNMKRKKKIKKKY